MSLIKKAARILLKLAVIGLILLLAIFILFESGVGGQSLLTAAGNRLGLEITAERLRIRKKTNRFLPPSTSPCR
jgi:hypothetical protein